MEFVKTKLSGSFIIKPNKIQDFRGFYSRVWDPESEAGIHWNDPRIISKKNSK